MLFALPLSVALSCTGDGEGAFSPVSADRRQARGEGNICPTISGGCRERAGPCWDGERHAALGILGGCCTSLSAGFVLCPCAASMPPPRASLRGEDRVSPTAVLCQQRVKAFSYVGPWLQTIEREGKLFPLSLSLAVERGQTRTEMGESRAGLYISEAVLSFLEILSLRAVRAASSRFTAGRGRPFPPCPSCPPHAGGGERALFPAGSGSGQSRGKGVDPLPSPAAGGAVWPLAEIRGKQHFSLHF